MSKPSAMLTSSTPTDSSAGPPSRSHPGRRRLSGAAPGSGSRGARSSCAGRGCCSQHALGAGQWAGAGERSSTGVCLVGGFKSSLSNPSHQRDMTSTTERSRGAGPSGDRRLPAMHSSVSAHRPRVPAHFVAAATCAKMALAPRGEDTTKATAHFHFETAGLLCRPELLGLTFEIERNGHGVKITLPTEAMDFEAESRSEVPALGGGTRKLAATGCHERSCLSGQA